MRNTHFKHHLLFILRLSCLIFLVGACDPSMAQDGATDLSQRIRFRRLSDEPFVPRTGNTFHSVLVANPAVAAFKGKLYFIFRGQDEGGKDQIGMWTTPLRGADGIHWKTHHRNLIIPVSKEANAPDNNHVLDPAVVVRVDSLYVYYTGKAIHRDPDHSINLSVSGDGKTFHKSHVNPIISKAIAPEVVVHKGLTHMFYQRLHPDGYWEVYAATSSNGIDFDTAQERKVFEPSRKAGAFDAFSVATVRIFREGEHYYMTYAACRRYMDYPESIGLARSKDLIHWERYAHNPIFTRGEAGSWDEGALWFPTVRKFGDRYVMWYEGAGTGLGATDEFALKASAEAREKEYGGYLKTSFSQIGMAVFDGSFRALFK